MRRPRSEAFDLNQKITEELTESDSSKIAAKIEAEINLGDIVVGRLSEPKGRVEQLKDEERKNPSNQLKPAIGTKVYDSRNNLIRP